MRSCSPRRRRGVQDSPCRVPNEPAGCGSRIFPPGFEILDVLERGAPTPDTSEVRIEHHVVLVLIDIERTRGEAFPRQCPRALRATSKAAPQLPVGVLVDLECEPVARVDRLVGHDLLGVVHGREETDELITATVVAQERRHEQCVVLQTRARG